METEFKCQDGYREAFNRLRGGIVDVMDGEDIIQERMLHLLETDHLKDYREADHLRRSLSLFVWKRKIRVKQQRDNMVSLNNGETETSGEDGSKLPVMVSLPKDYHLYHHIVNQFKADGKRIWTTKQLRVLAKRYLGGKNQSEIAGELGISQPMVFKIFNRIDKVILSLDIKGVVSSWGYRGEGCKAGEVWKDLPQNGEVKGGKVYSPIPSKHTAPPSGKISRPFNLPSKGWVDSKSRSGFKTWGGMPTIDHREVIRQSREDIRKRIDSLSLHYYQNVDHCGIVDHYTRVFNHGKREGENWITA